MEESGPLSDEMSDVFDRYFLATYKEFLPQEIPTELNFEVLSQCLGGSRRQRGTGECPRGDEA
jgi:hypothetical protein